MKTGYLRFVTFAAVVVGFLQMLFFWSISVLFLFWLTVISAVLCGITAFHLISNRGYRWLKSLPLIALPLWIVPVTIVAGIVGLVSNGMEGTRVDTLGDAIAHHAIGAVVVLPAWLAVNIPFWRILRRREVEEEFRANDRPHGGTKRRALLLGVSALLVIGLIAFTPIGDRQVRLIHEAARYGWTTVTRLLLAAGTHVDVRTREADTPLHVAAGEGRKGVVETLVLRGADINARNRSGETPLLRAIEGLYTPVIGTTSTHDFDTDSRVECALYLVRRGADVRMADGEGETPMRSALGAYKEEPKLLEALVDHGADINTKDSSGSTWLDKVILSGRTGEARKLMRMGARINPKAIRFARDTRSAGFLLEHGVDIDTRDEYGQTLLHGLMTGSEDLTLAKYVLRHGADVNARDKEGRTPLHLANANLNYDPLPRARLLIGAGADVNARDAKGKTPLFYACGDESASASIEYVKLLLEHGARVDIRDNENRSAIDYVWTPTPEEIDAITALLEKHGATPR